MKLTEQMYPGEWCCVGEWDLVPHVGDSREEAIIAASRALRGRIFVYGGCQWRRVDDPDDGWDLASYACLQVLDVLPC